jgi:hypothetical protein
MIMETLGVKPQCRRKIERISPWTISLVSHHEQSITAVSGAIEAASDAFSGQLEKPRQAFRMLSGGCDR